MQKRGLANYLENLFDGILNIFHRSGPRAPDPYPDPEAGSILIPDSNQTAYIKRKF